MFKKKLAVIAAACALSFGVSAYVAPAYSFAEDITYTKTDVQARAVEFFDFSKGDQQNWFAREDNGNGVPFYCSWNASMATWEDGKLNLSVDLDKNNVGPMKYLGAEYRTKIYRGYGRYEASYKPIKADGMVSSFFIYTGSEDNNEWDEIDFEILGKDTTKAQINYFRNGQGGHEYMVDLGFDAAEGFHTYAFDWHKDKIIWYVDGKEVHRVEQTAETADKDKIPFYSPRIMMNVWPGINVDGWLKPFDHKSVNQGKLTAQYEWVAFTPFDEGETLNNDK